MRNRDVERLITSHRESRNRAALAIGQHAIVLLDVRHQVGQEVVGERVGAGPDSRDSLRRSERHRPTERRARAVHVPGGHYDDHRFRAAGCDQVVEDEACATNRRPRIVDVACAVEKVEDWIAIAARLVTRRRVDVHPADAAERRRVVVNRGDSAVRHIFRIEQIRTGHNGEAVDGRVGLARRRIARVDDGQSIDHEDVAVRARRQRSERRLPDPVSIFRQLRQRDAAAADAGNVAGAPQLHLLCGRREDAKRHASIATHLGRRHHRTLRRASSRLDRRRRGRGGGLFPRHEPRRDQRTDE